MSTVPIGLSGLLSDAPLRAFGSASPLRSADREELAAFAGVFPASPGTLAQPPSSSVQIASVASPMAMRWADRGLAESLTPWTGAGGLMVQTKVDALIVGEVI